MSGENQSDGNRVWKPFGTGSTEHTLESWPVSPVVIKGTGHPSDSGYGATMEKSSSGAGVTLSLPCSGDNSNLVCSPGRATSLQGHYCVVDSVGKTRNISQRPFDSPAQLERRMPSSEQTSLEFQAHSCLEFHAQVQQLQASPTAEQETPEASFMQQQGSLKCPSQQVSLPSPPHRQGCTEPTTQQLWRSGDSHVNAQKTTDTDTSVLHTHMAAAAEPGGKADNKVPSLDSGLSWYMNQKLVLSENTLGSTPNRSIEEPATGWPELPLSWQQNSDQSWQFGRHPSGQASTQSSHHRPEAPTPASNVKAQMSGLKSFTGSNTRTGRGSGVPTLWPSVLPQTADISQGTLDVDADGSCLTPGASQRPVDDSLTVTDGSHVMPKLSRKPPDVSSKPPGVTPKPYVPGSLSANPRSPGVDPRSPGVGTRSLGVDHRSPCVGPGSPGVNPRSPGVDPRSPGVGTRSPGVDHRSPCVSPGSPGVNPRSPGVGTRSPGVDPRSPSVGPKPPGPQPSHTGQRIVDVSPCDSLQQLSIPDNGNSGMPLTSRSMLSADQFPVIPANHQSGSASHFPVTNTTHQLCSVPLCFFKSASELPVGNVTEVPMGSVPEFSVNDVSEQYITCDPGPSVSGVPESSMSAATESSMSAATGLSRGGAPGIAPGLSMGDAGGLSMGDARGLSMGDARGLSMSDAGGLSMGDARGLSMGDARGLSMSDAGGLSMGDAGGLSMSGAPGFCTMGSGGSGWPSGGSEEASGPGQSMQQTLGSRSGERRPDYTVQRSMSTAVSASTPPSLRSIPVADDHMPLLPVQDQTWAEIDVDKEGFVRTAIMEEAMHALDSASVVVLTSPPRGGKSTLARALLRHAEDENRTCCTVRNVSEWRKFVRSDQSMIVLLDEVFGQLVLKRGEVDAWKPSLEGMSQWCRQRAVQLVFTFTPPVLESLRQLLPQCDLFSQMHEVCLGRLSEEEKRRIFQSVLWHRLSASDVKRLVTEAKGCGLVERQAHASTDSLQLASEEREGWEQLCDMLADWVLAYDDSGALFPECCRWFAKFLTKYTPLPGDKKHLQLYLGSSVKIFSRPSPLYRDFVLQLLQEEDLGKEKMQAVLALLLAGTDINDVNQAETVAIKCRQLGFSCACSPVSLLNTMKSCRGTLIDKGSAKFINRHAYEGAALALLPSLVVKVVDWPFLVKRCRVSRTNTNDSGFDEEQSKLFLLEIRRLTPGPCREMTPEYKALVLRIAKGLADSLEMVLAVQHPALQFIPFVNDLVEEISSQQEDKNARLVLSETFDRTHRMSLLYWSLFNTEYFLFQWIFKTVIKLHGHFREDELVLAAYACCVLRGKEEFLGLLLRYWKKAAGEDVSKLLKGHHVISKPSVLHLPLPRADVCLTREWKDEQKYIKESWQRTGAEATSFCMKNRESRAGDFPNMVSAQTCVENSVAQRGKGLDLLRAPLLVAVEFNQEEVVNLLLTEYEYTATVTDSMGRTALHMAACHGHLNIVKQLLRHGVQLWQKDKRGNTALDEARVRGQDEVVSLLLDAEGARSDPAH
ncbi:uncharacterized protein LOC143289244 [Babylonia areolata]|uniref:uncharacterized protein LOC143289244 n=1 Tax=Babylonia areolata TaxID=304850 RepID=UPI003FD28285